MKSLNKIIREEYIRFLKEAYDEDDVATDYFNREDEIKSNLFTDFLYHNNVEFTKHVPWKVISFPRLKRIWETYMSMGIVRDTRGLEDIKEIMIDNTIKVSIFTNLAGHTQWGDEEAFEDNIGYWVDEQLNCTLSAEKPQDRNQLEIPFENPKKGYVQKEPAKQPEPCNTTVHPFVQNYVDENYNGDSVDREDVRGMLYSEMKSRFFDYYMDDPDHKLGGFISDYGLKPLETLLGQLVRSNKPEDDVPIIDKMLNVIHQRSDIASWFVEGGSASLSALSGEISAPYQMSDYR